MVHRRADFFAAHRGGPRGARPVRAQERREPARVDPAGPDRPAAGARCSTASGIPQVGESTAVDLARCLARRVRPDAYGRAAAIPGPASTRPVVRRRRGGAAADRDRGARRRSRRSRASARRCPRRCTAGSRTRRPSMRCASSSRRASCPSVPVVRDGRRDGRAGPLAGQDRRRDRVASRAFSREEAEDASGPPAASPRARSRRRRTTSWPGRAPAPSSRRRRTSASRCSTRTASGGCSRGMHRRSSRPATAPRRETDRTRGIMPRSGRHTYPEPDARRSCMSLRGRLSMLGAVAVLVAACTQRRRRDIGAQRGRRAAAPSEAAPSAASMAPSESASAAPIAGGLLDKVLKAGKIVISTDPELRRRSPSLKTDGTYEGFDIDVGTEIAKRLGVDDRVRDPELGRASPPALGRPLGLQRRFDDDHVEAPEGRSTSATRTTSRRPRWPRAPRRASRPSTGSPARPSASARRRPTSTGSNGRARLRDRVADDDPAGRRQGHDPRHDRLCAETWKAGPDDFEGWLSSSHDRRARRSRTGCRSSRSATRCSTSRWPSPSTRPARTRPTWSTRVNQILTEMHDDGTLAAIPEKWFGLDLTEQAGRLTPSREPRGRVTRRGLDAFRSIDGRCSGRARTARGALAPRSSAASERHRRGDRPLATRAPRAGFRITFVAHLGRPRRRSSSGR